MTQTKVAIEIDKIKKLLISKYQPQKIILFGSYAWGKPNKDSDLDLFIIKNVTQPRPEREQDVYRLLTSYYSRQNSLPLDVIVHTPKETEERATLGDPFIRQILDHGRIIYERT